MSFICSDQAWNNFVMLSTWEKYEAGSSKRHAGLACLYMNLANNGGLNSFLTSTYDISPQEVLDALLSVGASTAANQLEAVVQGLGISLPTSSQKARWDALNIHWTDPLNEFDVLSEEADRELIAVLTCHVHENEAFYLSLGNWQSPFQPA
jgi:hypothetical protein